MTKSSVQNSGKSSTGPVTGSGGATNKTSPFAPASCESLEGVFDNYEPLLRPFLTCIDWEQIENDKYMPRPQKGLDPEIDEILARMDAIKVGMRALLEKVRRKFDSDRIVFASNRKYRHQLEVPHEVAERVEADDNFFVTTRLKGVRRFLCSELSNLTTSMNDEEQLYKARISPLIRDMFERFYQAREHWLNAVKCMAEVDALCALADISN